jgi:hypothetical protein
MESNIFHVFYSSYGIYTKIFTIFESAHDLIHKIKHQSLLNKKEKEKENSAVKRPADRPTSALPARIRSARAPSLSGTLTGRPHLSVLSPTRAAARPRLRRPIARSSASARAHRLRLTSADRSLPLTRALPSSVYRNHVTGGRPPWPTIVRPSGYDRAQTDGLASFHRGWEGWCSRCKARGSSGCHWRRRQHDRAGAPAPASSFRRFCSRPKEKRESMSY